MVLELKKPLVIFDLETTGINISNDRIVEISYLKIHPNQKEEGKTIRVNPGIPIPPESTAVHKISDADVANCPQFKEIAKELAATFTGCDFAGFNSNKFDVPLLAEEFLRAKVDFDWTKPKFIDAHVIFCKKEQRTLTAAYQFYCDKELTDAHAAESDTKATYEVLLAQLERYQDLPRNIEELSAYSAHNRNADFAGRIVYDDNDREVFNFGKHKGKLVSEVFNNIDPSYYSWIMHGEFPLYTKQVITKIKLREFGK